MRIARTGTQAILHLADQRLQGEFGIADKRVLGRHVLVQISRVEGRMDDDLPGGMDTP